MPVDSSDVEILLGRDLTTPEANRVDRLIELATGLVQGAIPGFTLDEDTETVDVWPPEPYSWSPASFWTPKYPVSAVEITGLSAVRFTEKGHVTYGWPASVNSPDWDLPLAVPLALTYTFGFAAIPDDVVSVIAAMVAVAINRQANGGGVYAETLGAYSVTYGDWTVQQAAQGLTVPPGALDRWRRKEVSVPLTR